MNGSPANAWQMCLFPSSVMPLGEEAVVKELGRGEGARQDGRGWVFLKQQLDEGRLDGDI